MASSDHGPPRPPPVPTEPDAQAAGWTRLDDADQVASELLEADAQRARQYLVRSARLAQEYLTDTAPDADEASADKLATAEQTAAELLVTAQQAAAGLLATAKKVAADRVAGSHRFEAMFRDHQAVMLLIDPATGQIVDANPAAAAFYGYPREELIAMPITQINVMPADEVAERLAQAQFRRHSHFSFPHRLANGDIRRVDVVSSPIHDGRPLLFSIINDAENRVLAEEELARQRLRLELVLSASRLGMWDWNMVTGETVFDDRWAEIVGYRLEDLEPLTIETWLSLCHPDDLAASFGLIDRHARGLSPFYDIECRMRHRDGRWVWVHDRGKIVERTPDGRPARMTGTHEEVSAAHLAVEALAAAEEDSRLAFDRSRVATCLVSNQGRLVRVNPAICDLLGRSEAELLDMGFLDVTHPEDVEVGAELLRDLLEGRSSTLRLTKRYVRGDGRVIWGDVTVSAVRDEDGAVRHRIAQILDVTAEYELRESLMESQRIAHVGGWHLDVATGSVTWSPELHAMFGLDPAEKVPAFPDQQRLFTPDSWERLTGAVSKALETGATYDLELETVRADGTHGWVQGRGEAIRDTSGAIVELHGVSLDITARKTAEESLAASEDMLRVVLNTSRDATIRVDRSGRVEFVNQRVVDVSGVPFELWIGKTFAQMGYPAELTELWEAHRQSVFQTGQSVTFAFEIDNKDGNRWYETTCAPEANAEGRVEHVIETSRDVTERMRVEAALRAGQAQLQQAQRIAHVGSWALDMATSHVTWSEELYLMLGLDPQVPPPDYTEHSRLFTPDSWRELSRNLALTLESGVPYELELEMVRPDGSHGWMLALGESVRDVSGAIVGLQGVAVDITERKQVADELRLLATHDPLTGLANRAALLDETSRAVSAGRRSGRPAVVLMLDLDRFKIVNDTQGHAAGDELLVAAASRIQNVVRAGDLVARLGGDEFVVVMRDLDEPGEAVEVARRLVTAFRGPFHPAGLEVYTTASVGVAMASDSGDAGDLIREADTAMYTAKEDGGDRLEVFNEGLRAEITARLAVETDLRHALERGELAVWYQPEVDLATGAVIALEALIRWHHPDGQVWTADRFMRVAEETGLVLDIGDWALHQACIQAAGWAAARPDRSVIVRVNLSAVQLSDADLLDSLDDALATSGLDPGRLCLEITETTLLRQTVTARDNLVGVHRRGIDIAIDDFGTGYASLTYLRSYPVDLLKIDRSFITHLTTEERDRRLVAGIIALARQVNVSVTAEGVEHPDQADLLRDMGCAAAQGFLFSPALAGDLVAPLLD